MEFEVLAELIECSVCLERMDTKSRVLPCQHTFCSDCLERIAQSKKELKCPECRAVCTTSVKDLPPNILLVRLLDGLKTAGKVLPTKQEVLHLVSQPCAKALYSYEPQESGDLPFRRGDLIYLKKKLDVNWYVGELNGKQGFLPATYVQVICPIPPRDSNKSNASNQPAQSQQQVPAASLATNRSSQTLASTNQQPAPGRLKVTVTALYDFVMKDGYKEDCLRFKKDDKILLIRRVDQNWAEGAVGGCVGIFPLSYVELTEAAHSLLSAPKAPQTRSKIPDPSGPSLTALDIPQRNTNTTNATSTTNIVTTSTKRHSLNIPVSAASQVQPVGARTQTERYSTGDPTSVATSPTISPSCTMLTINSKPPPIVRSVPPDVATAHTTTDVAELSASGLMYRAMFNYKPQKDDELSLKRGCLYNVSEKCRDGWYRGRCMQTGRSGVFPGNYVQPLSAAESETECKNASARDIGSVSDGGDNSGPKRVVSQTKLDRAQLQRDRRLEDGRKFSGLDTGSQLITQQAATADKPRRERVKLIRSHSARQARSSSLPPSEQASHRLSHDKPQRIGEAQCVEVVWP